ncbi:MarR family winged helix-turn-helix transcriptional regulator [Microbacterium sp.]|jgi:DNA-binding MarR family transcriptional regulator|uniref:MarR family winged helix-turn-helix transcriptional regulator n=1 Tax=Microbacterium sp. TaxID=51671 RepID=UPI002C682D37|nr:MarR family transcriptional regulator [Microbacterium sp.]HWL77901.1 MarR family transcriptional regulator [Microbacterium sp.]
MTARDTDPEDRAVAVRVLEAELSDLVNRFRRQVRDAAERIEPGMHPGAYKVFVRIARDEPITVSALSEALTLDKGLTSRTVAWLEKVGLVERASDPNDRRSSLLSLTDEGRRRLEHARSPERSDLAEALQAWSTDDVRRFAVLLHAFGLAEKPGDFDELESTRRLLEK